MHAPIRGALAASIALVCATLLAGCESLKSMLESGPRPSARVIAVNLQNLTLEKVDLVFNVEVANPYGVDLPLLDLSYSIGSDGHRIVQGGVKPSGAIPAKGSQVIQLPAIVQFAALRKAVQGVRPGSVVPYKAELSLGVDAPVLGRLDVPFSKSGEMPVPAVPEAELVSFEISKLSLDQVKATAKLRLKNTNQFPLDVSKFNIQIALGGSEVANVNLAKAKNVPAGQSAALELPLAFSPRSFGTTLLNLLRGDKASYGLVGSIEAKTPYGPVTLPFNGNGSTNIKK